MTATVTTDAGSAIPADVMLEWCKMWADGDRRLRSDEIAANVFGRRPALVQGQLWERVSKP